MGIKMKHTLYSFIFLSILGCGPEQKFENLESKLFTKSIQYQIDSVEIQIPAEIIHDSLQKNIVYSSDSLYFNEKKINDNINYSQSILSESLLLDKINNKLIRNKESFDPNILAKHYGGLLKHNASIWFDIYLDNYDSIRLLSISDQTNNFRIKENYIYRNGKIILIKKVLVESKRTGWEHVSNNVFESEYSFSDAGLMTNKVKDFKEFPEHSYNEGDYNYDLKEKGDSEYLRATYLFEIANYIINSNKWKCIDQNLKVIQTKNEIEKIFNDSIKLDISNFGRLRPNFTAVIEINENGKISDLKILNRFMNIIQKDNKDILEQMSKAFKKLQWLPAESNCKRIKSKIRVQYRHDGNEFQF